MAAPQQLLPGIVRSVSSGDTIVVRARHAQIGGQERQLHIAGISAPRMGSRDREDEPHAFLSREFLRLKLVGKEIRFRIEHTVPSSDPGSAPREFAHVFLPPKAPGLPDTNVAEEIVATGWAKVRDGGTKRTTDGGEEPAWRIKLQEAQAVAKERQQGVWDLDELVKVAYMMPEDSVAFLSEWKGKPVDSIVEQVRDGSTIRARMLLSPKHHQFINLSLAGIKAPRTTGSGGVGPAEGEEFGEEAKFFVESRLLQRNIKIILLSLPSSAVGPTPFAATASTPAPPPAPASIFIGIAEHPVGNIAEFLLSSGLARCVDWHAGMLSSFGGMEKYRRAERVAKEKRLNLWKSYSAPTTGPAATPLSARTFDAVVSRIVSGDTIAVRKPTGVSTERRIQLSSTRQPRPAEAKFAGYQAEAREFLRRKLIGKNVLVTIDYVKPADGEFGERECGTVKLKDVNISELLIERGLATALRHRRDDEDRSSEYDKLMAAESKAAAEGKGIHSGKEMPLPRVVDASENVTRANQVLSGLKRSGRVPAVVDFISSGSRFKLLLPKENQRLTFVLAGIRAPRTARNSSEKDEPFGKEALEFTTRRALQRDVEVEFVTTDKVGGFIGVLYLNKTENFAVTLVQEGLAQVHDYTAEGMTFSSQLYEAQASAKKEQKNLWKDYDAEAEAAEQEAANGAAGHLVEPPVAQKEYKDVVVSEVRGGGKDEPFGFAVQILDESSKSFEQLMADFAAFHVSSTPAPTSFIPRSGDVVSARFTADDAWYRARVRKSNPGKKEAEVHFFDYGNGETLPWSRLKPLDNSRFGIGKMPAQAHEATLSFIRLVEGNEYAVEAVDAFRQVAEGRKLVANVDAREGGVLHLTLYDPSNPAAAGSPDASINVDLVRDGLAVVDRKSRYAKAYPGVLKTLNEAELEARRTHAGAFEYGDFQAEEDSASRHRR